MISVYLLLDYALHHIKNLKHVKKQNSTFLITFAATNNNLIYYN